MSSGDPKPQSAAVTDTKDMAEADQAALSVGRGTSLGVRRIEAVARHISLVDRVLLFVGIFIVAYVYSLDISLRYAYQPTATDSFSSHSLLATISVLRSIIASAAQPTAAKIADVFGRIELLLLSIVFYVVGTIVDATSDGVKSFSAGAVLYQVGFTCVSFLVEVLLSDITSLRSRLFFSYIPVSPFLINAWASGDVAEAALSNIGWRFGIGMWAIIYPVSTIPLMLVLYWAHHKAKEGGNMNSYTTDFQMDGGIKHLFWKLDVPGMILMIAVLALVLVPLTLAGDSSATWHKAHILAPLIIGVACIPAFILWETSKAQHPMVPFHLLKDRTVWGGLGIVTAMNCAASVQGDYLYTVLTVSFNQSVLSATRITNLYSFVSCLTGLAIGLVVYKLRRLKWIIVCGSALHLVAFGLLIHFRGGGDAPTFSGMVGAQVLLGISCGMFTYATLASIQAATRHEHLAVITGVYFACFNIGGAIGNAISGAIWTQILPGRLQQDLGDGNLSTLVYDSPFTAIKDFAWGSPERDAIVVSYRYTQRILCITGICVASFVCIFALCLRDVHLTKDQSLPDAEGKDKKNGTA